MKTCERRRRDEADDIGKLYVHVVYRQLSSYWTTHPHQTYNEACIAMELFLSREDRASYKLSNCWRGRGRQRPGGVAWHGTGRGGCTWEQSVCIGRDVMALWNARVAQCVVVGCLHHDNAIHPQRILENNNNG